MEVSVEINTVVHSQWKVKRSEKPSEKNSKLLPFYKRYTTVQREALWKKRVLPKDTPHWPWQGFKPGALDLESRVSAPPSFPWGDKIYCRLNSGVVVERWTNDRNKLLLRISGLTTKLFPHWSHLLCLICLLQDDLVLADGKTIERFLVVNKVCFNSILESKLVIVIMYSLDYMTRVIQ